MAELEGRASTYHNKWYEELIKQIVPIRRAFRLEKDISARKEMAREEVSAWNTYVEARKQQIKDEDMKEFQIEEMTLSLLKE